MQKIHAAITGVAGYVPDDILSNADLEKMVDTTDEWITSRTGIKERRILRKPGLGSSDLGAPAVKSLLEKTGTDPDEIDIVICGTVIETGTAKKIICVGADKNVGNYRLSRPHNLPFVW